MIIASRLEAEPTTSEARLLLARLQTDNARRSKALDKCGSSSDAPPATLTDDTKRILFAEHKRLTSQWKAHKVAYKELIGILVENCVPLVGADDGTIRHKASYAPPDDAFFDDLGVVTDEADAKQRIAAAANESGAANPALLRSASGKDCMLGPPSFDPPPGTNMTYEEACAAIKRVRCPR